MPSSITVAPPSGTVPKDSRDVNPDCPSAAGLPTWKLPKNGVDVKPFPLMLPLIKTLKKPPVWETIVELTLSNVNPSTVQKAGVTPEVKAQGAASVTASPTPTQPTKPPEKVSIFTAPQVETW